MSFAQLIFGFFIAACSFKRQSGIQTSKHGFHRLKVVLKSLLTIVVYHSMFNGAAVDELVKDAMHFTLPSSTRDSTVVRNASLALAWLESVFTGLAAWSESTGKEPVLSSFMLKAHAHVPLDASVLLQVSNSNMQADKCGNELESTWDVAETLLNHKPMDRFINTVVCTKCSSSLQGF
jgi:hypothetical protein